MQTRKSFFTNPLVVVSLGCVLAFAAACGDDDDSNPNPGSAGTKTTAGTSNAGGEPSSTGGKASTGGKTSTGGTTVVGVGGGAAGDSTGTAGAGGAAPVSCTDDTDMGCYSCKPKTLDQFLNACPTTGCEPFDNSVLTSIKAGKLPALP